MSEQRIIELEEKIAHLEHGLQTLGDTVYTQQRLLERLGDQVRLLSDQVKPLIQEPGSASSGHEPPPHY